ncbi:MAG: tRNA pseudouridine(55) synthase TruB [bacterium]|nr:tRNA pseudouridine(55) synthase TruB [bacterium]
MTTDGFLLIDKPAGWTSHDVVAKVRGVTRVKKVGHGGTLDPMATGLLVLGFGKATKQLERFVQGDKTYVAEAALGATSDTDDAEGTVTPAKQPERPTEAEVETALESFRGNLQQLPPVYSAIKTNGRKAYAEARKGRTVERKPRSVTVHEMALLGYRWPTVRFRCRVSKGTYVRSIARDLGEKLGTGGYLSALRREAIGSLRVEEAVSIGAVTGQSWYGLVIPSDDGMMDSNIA